MSVYVDLLKQYCRQFYLLICGPADYVGMGSTFVLSKLLKIDLWFNKNNLSDADILTTLNFFRFWENVSRNGDQSLVDTTISMVNYCYAATFLTRLSELNPDILTRYHKYYGKFYSKSVGEEDFDNWNRAWFRDFNLTFCFISRLGERQLPCVPAEKSLAFKPGRTFKLLFENRPILKDCTMSAKESDGRKNDIDVFFWMYIFRRPGNFTGRSVERLLLKGQERTMSPSTET